MARIKTRYVGVYYRFAKHRIMADGKPDKCYDILYHANGKYVWEKIGWRSEGYTVEDAITIRGLRVKAIRHPELMREEQAPQPDDGNDQQTTISDLWNKYTELYFPQLKNKRFPSVMYNKYIKPVFENTPASSITKLDVEKLKSSLLAKEQKSGEKLSRSYINKIISLLGRLLNRGVEWNMVDISNNPISHTLFSDADKKRERFLTRAEASKILDGLRCMHCEAYIFAKISLFTGMRLSEIASIKKHNINIDARIVHVEGKTGFRSAYIPENLVSIFTYLKNREHPKYKEQCFDRDVSTMSRYFRFVVQAIGLNSNVSDSRYKVVFHTLRHTFCSWLAMEGIALYTIGELVGHKKLEMTKRYAKLSPDTKREALNKISRIL
ncbi:site-specific integrase [uncultured Desulfovibrio sp.]|uniref:tyrosine-type recombinase/integrase n=1 Tax=uncultured Desulfovibrio sp. TaxID=167968 RepID=UPI00258960E4|nr:site-specific integrase [uncultured Desulfovibrio sp.]